MSWHFSLAGVEESWEGYSLNGAPDALLRLIPTQDASYWPGSEMESFRHSQSGTTSARSTETHGEDASTSLAAGSHVKTSVPQGKDQESQANEVVFGNTWQELPVKFDLNSCSWKTRQCSFTEDCTLSSVILPRWGMMRLGVCWELGMLEPCINETGCGYWPTPSGTSNHGKNHVVGRLDEWGGSSNRFRGTSLQRVRCPEFEEWMMGWPEGWSNAQTALEMDKFQRWRDSHGTH